MILYSEVPGTPNTWNGKMASTAGAASWGKFNSNKFRINFSLISNQVQFNSNFKKNMVGLVAL